MINIILFSSNKWKSFSFFMEMLFFDEFKLKICFSFPEKKNKIITDRRSFYNVVIQRKLISNHNNKTTYENSLLYHYI